MEDTAQQNCCELIFILSKLGLLFRHLSQKPCQIRSRTAVSASKIYSILGLTPRHFAALCLEVMQQDNRLSLVNGLGKGVRWDPKFFTTPYRKLQTIKTFHVAPHSAKSIMVSSSPTRYI